MVGRILLVVAITLIASATAADASEIDDELDGGLFGAIVSDQGGGRVDLEAMYDSETRPRGGGQEGDPVGSGDVGSGTNDAPAIITPPPAENCSPTNVATCAGEPTAPPEEPEEPIVVTLRDIASFRPAVPGNDMEPGGWAIEGLHANFVAEASVEVVSGTLLGQPADVRFTPVGYRWTHSDGAAIDSATPGATWATLGQREFTETPTSHVYAASGEYTVVLTVVLSAEYRFAGSPWRPIAGTLSLAGEPQRVLVGQFDTVLTRGDCNAHPSGPGC